MKRKSEKYYLSKPIVENGINFTYLTIISYERDSFSWITRRSTKETLFYPHIALKSLFYFYFISQHSEICILEIICRKRNNVVRINKNKNRNGLTREGAKCISDGVCKLNLNHIFSDCAC